MKTVTLPHHGLELILNNNWITLHSRKCFGPSMTINGFTNDGLVELALIHRAIGTLLDTLQPGVVSPVPDGSPDLVDAMKILHEVDRIWRDDA